jgi:nucleotide-binding universal stress UspA family protein
MQPPLHGVATGDCSRLQGVDSSTKSEPDVATASRGDAPVETIIVPLDGPESERALPLAKRLARESSAGIVLVHIARLRSGTRGGGTHRRLDHVTGEARLREIVRQLRHEGFPARLDVQVAAFGHVADHIADAAERHRSSAIVLATRGYGAIVGALTGSVTRRLLAEAPCPVLVVPSRSTGDAFLASGRPAVGMTVLSVAAGM